jgi:thioesterase domain-containing protein
VTGFVFTLACFKALLHRFTGQTDLVVASPVAQRSTETENVIGPFAEPIAFRTQIPAGGRFIELLSAVNETVHEALSHSAAPFDLLERELRVKSVNGRNPLFQFHFTYQKEFVSGRKVGSLEIDTYPMPPSDIPYELQLGFIERPNGVDMRMDFDPDAFDRSSIRTLLDNVISVIGDVLADPEVPVASLLSNSSGQAIREAPLSTSSSSGGEERQYVAPRTEDEKALARIWEQVLGLEPVGIRTDFFELGGYSLALLRLFAQINKTFGTSLAAPTIFKYPTIESLARHLRSERHQDDNDIIVPIRVAGSNPPFFMVHSYHLYAELPGLLGSEQPFYGIQEFGRVDRTGRLTLETMMAEYVQQIRQIQPHGPYLLGGFCSATLPAFEVARQLEAAGEHVALLAIIESPETAVAAAVPGTPSRHGLFDYFSRRWRELAFHARAMRQLSWRERADFGRQFAARKARKLSLKLDRWIWSSACRFYLRMGLQLPMAIQRKLCSGIRIVTLEATRGYRPKMYHGRIDLIKGSDTPAGTNGHASKTWGAVTSGEVQVTYVPGDHDSMFAEPHLRVFAARLRSLIEEALQRVPSERSAQELGSTRCN